MRDKRPAVGRRECSVDIPIVLIKESAITFNGQGRHYDAPVPVWTIKFEGKYK
jgi:hypothetical protein